MRARRFPGCALGPLSLRRVLRARLQPGEPVVGWAVATIGPVWWWRGLDMATAVAPPLLLARTVGAVDATRVLVLTDRRLLSIYAQFRPPDERGRMPLSPDAAEADGVMYDGPLHALHVRELNGAGGRRFVVADARGRWKQTAKLSGLHTPPAVALREGLSVLAETTPDPSEPKRGDRTAPGDA